MKTTITIILIGFIMILIASCSSWNNTSQTTEVVVIRDVTDTLIALPKADEISFQFDLNSEMWNGGVFRLVDLTDVSYNRIHETRVDAENEWINNKFQRSGKVTKFYSEINKIISDAEKEEIGKDNSSVYFPIAKELNKLSQSPATKKVMLIYSDLMENTDEMSFYNENNISLLKTNPNAVKKLFNSQLELKNLNGIKIYFVFQPANMKEDLIYKTISNFYKNLLESKGASKVEITASVN